jgi:two-component system sensor histidine kinase KdpD
MLASLSHDLRTPIAGILGAASSLRAYGGRHDPETQETLLSSIETEADRMQRYVHKLLDMTRLDAGGVRPRMEPVDPADAVTSIAARAGAIAVDRRVITEIEPSLPFILADAGLLDQALFNLVENALVHARVGPVTLKVRRSGAGVIFEVLDEGPGLPPGEESRIFDRFMRSTAASSGGTGLGLAIVKGFADLMGAGVEGANRADRPGAVFSLTFPAAGQP